MNTNHQDKYINVTDVMGYDIQTRYWEEGHGDTSILFLHGIGNSLEICLPCIDVLSKKYRFVAVDFPGHGKTAMCPDKRIYTNEGFMAFIYRFVECIAFKTPIIVMAHSLGGIAATRFASQQPEMVQRLILIDPGGFEFNAVLKFRFASIPLIGRLAFSDTVLEWTSRRKKARLPASEYMNESYIDLDTNYLKQNHGEAVIALLQNEVTFIHGYKRALSSDELKRVIAPVLLFWGKKDKTIPVFESNRALRELSNSRLVLFEDAKHRPHVSHTDEVNQYTLEFIEKGYLEDERKNGKTILR